MVADTQEYEDCRISSTTTEFELLPGATQMGGFVGINAKDFTAVLTLERGSADLVWSVQDSVGEDILGPGTDVTDRGNYVFRGVEFYFTGRDSTPETISSELVRLATYVEVTAGPEGAKGTVVLYSSGQAPCGTVTYCRHVPTGAPTTSPTTVPTPSPTNPPTGTPSTDMPTVMPTKNPITSEPTFDPTTDAPSMKPAIEPTVKDGFSVPPTTCDKGTMVARVDELEEELEDLEDQCNKKEEEYQELFQTCDTPTTDKQCADCLDLPTVRNFNGSLPSPVISVTGPVSTINIPEDYDTGYPDQTEYKNINGEVYINLGNDQYQRTCVGYGLEASSCDSSKYVCAGGNTYGTLEQLAAAIKVSATERADKVHPNCPTGCLPVDATLASIFQNQDTDLDVSRICHFADEYYYIEDNGQYTYTCVGYGHETEVCPSYKMVCVGFEETSGLPTYGWFGEQARAVKIALNNYGNVYPSCPGSTNA